jgi:hypothetical protein
MFTYIDESGAFVYAGDEKHAYSCVGALTIPGRFHGKVLKSFKRLKRQWHSDASEVKGKDLKEAQVAAVIDMLLECHCHFHVCATDMMYNPPEIISARKNAQAARLMAHMTDKHRPKLIQQIQSIQAKMKAMPDQLFVQFCVMTGLVSQHLQDSVMHYAFDDPPELGEFRWIVDRKACAKTDYEDLWHTLISPILEGQHCSTGSESRVACVEGGDYSYFEKFCTSIDKWPSYLPAPRQQPPASGPINVILIGKILRDSFTLGDSKSFAGLQLADIVTNAFRRAISGRLQYPGWRNLGKLMFRWGSTAIQLIHFNDNATSIIPVVEELPAKVIMHMTKMARTVLESPRLPSGR